MRINGFRKPNIKKETTVKSAHRMIGIIQTVCCYVPQIRVWHEDRWIKTHHQLIHFGRDMCTARNPQCENCKISGI